MRVLSRYLAREIYAGTTLVFAALLTLFAFFDLIHELGDVGKGHYELKHALAFVLLSIPGHVYELFPIAALIGTVFALAQLSAHSELTVMRVSGVSLLRIAFSLGRAGLWLAALTLVFGELIAPSADRAAQQLRLKAMSSVVAQEFRSGLWVKDETSFINVEQVLPDSTLLGVRIYQLDSSFRLRSVSFAQRGDYEGNNRWRLTGVQQTLFDGSSARVQRLSVADWHSVLNPELLSVLLVSPEQMSIGNLYDYIQHLQENRQKASPYEIALWRKLTYPFAVLVMMFLAVPFVHHDRRSAGIGAKVFAGIMLGLSFYLLNRLFSHLGLLNDWPPVFSAVFPTAVFLMAALVVIGWMERR